MGNDGSGPVGAGRIGRLIVLGTAEALEVLVGKSGRVLTLAVPFMSAAIGISIVVGVGSSVVTEEAGDDVSLRRAFVAGDIWVTRCDLRLCRSIMLIAQASRSTGVRLAACIKRSES